MDENPQPGQERRVSQCSYHGNDRRREQYVYDQPMMAGNDKPFTPSDNDGTDVLGDQAP